MPSETRHVVMFSGGVGSWGAARRVIAQHGRQSVTLLFTDTLCEDADLYRFLLESAAHLMGHAGRVEVSGLVQQAARTPPVWERDARKAHILAVRELARTILPELVWLTDGRDVWDVFAHHRFLGNSQVGLCTDRLKSRPAEEWREASCDPAATICYVGIDWTEEHRFVGDGGKRRGLKARMADKGWRYEAPMCEPPYQTKDMMLDELRKMGIAPPRLYALGFAHNNCGGICVKAGIGHYALLHRALPAVFDHAEAEEQKLRDLLGNVAMLSDRTGGAKRPLPLTQLRRRIEADEPLDLFEIGGCGCFIDSEAA